MSFEQGPRRELRRGCVGWIPLSLGIGGILLVPRPSLCMLHERKVLQLFRFFMAHLLGLRAGEMKTPDIFRLPFLKERFRVSGVGAFLLPFARDMTRAQKQAILLAVDLILGAAGAGLYPGGAGRNRSPGSSTGPDLARVGVVDDTGGGTFDDPGHLQHPPERL